jgi:hypothetical protein
MKVKIRKKISDDDFHKLKTLRIAKNDDSYEVINGVPLKKNRADSVAVVNHLGIVIRVEGNNPRRLNPGDNIYEM